MDYPEEFQREVKLEFYRGGLQSLREAGFAALKALITLNSGAFVVLLTFIGNTSAQSQFMVPLTYLKIAMFCFLGGLAAVFCSLLQTYLSSRVSSPYLTHEKRGIPEWANAALSVVFPILSFLAFLAGVVVVILNVDLA